MQEVGLVPKAVIEAEALTHEESTIETLLALIQSQVLIGDLKGIAVSARSLLDRADVPAGELLRVGRLLLSEDQDLARQLWRRAVKIDPLDPDAVVAVVNLAFALGLEDEVRPLLQRMHELAAAGCPAVQRVGFPDLLSIMRSRAEQVSTIDSAYRSGQVPVHVVGQLLNIPFVTLVPGAGRRNRINPDPRRQPPMLIRHGSRGLRDATAARPDVKRLYIDITGLLVAHDLGILDAVEHCFRPVWISPSAVPALVAQIDALTPSQPAYLAGQAHVIELVERGALGTIDTTRAPADEDADLVLRMGDQWVGLLARARCEGSYLVEYLPLTKQRRRPFAGHIERARCRTCHQLPISGGCATTRWGAIFPGPRAGHRETWH